jgi:tetratricopeptide (TPR) repeat protein
MAARFVGVLLVLALCPLSRTWGADRNPRWIEVRSAHFTVYSDGGVKPASQVARQFEQIRELFHRMWPWARVDPALPIVILAARDESSLKTLLPEYWERKGGVHPAGIFVRGEDRHYIALRTDLGEAFDSLEENPYHLVYHEYSHLILDLNFGRLPPWINEGLAEFYGATIIGRDLIRQGKPLRHHIYLLRERVHLPLEKLLTVDYRSPEYNEENRVTIFYAQSWALVHYFLLGDKGAHWQQFASYANLLLKNVPESEARPALGDVRKLGEALESYVRNYSFQYARIKFAGETATHDVQSRETEEGEALAVRGDFHLARGRLEAARPLLEQAVERVPELAAAHASLGRLALREQKPDEARRRVARAVELDSKSHLVHYLHAILNMGPGQTGETMAAAEQSLNRSVDLNHDFAPAYALLAEVSAYRSGDYAGALPLARRAIALEPGVISHRLSLGRLLAGMGKFDQARAEGERALGAARADWERESAQRFLDSLVRPTPPVASASPAPEEAAVAPVERASPEPARRASAGGVRLADVDGRPSGPGGNGTLAKGTILSMTCAPDRSLLFVFKTASGPLTLRASSPDGVFIKKGGAWVQMNWTCGALGIPATARYVPSRAPGAGKVDGTVLAFDLDR